MYIVYIYIYYIQFHEYYFGGRGVRSRLRFLIYCGFSLFDFSFRFSLWFFKKILSDFFRSISDSLPDVFYLGGRGSVRFFCFDFSFSFCSRFFFVFSDFPFRFLGYIFSDLLLAGVFDTLALNRFRKIWIHTASIVYIYISIHATSILLQAHWCMYIISAPYSICYQAPHVIRPLYVIRPPHVIIPPCYYREPHVF